MEIRVFVRKIPKNCSKNEFVDAIKRKTKGSRRVLYVCKPNYTHGYGLVWYSSLESALAAQKTVLTIKDALVELLIYDDPRNPTDPATDVNNRLGLNLTVDGESVQKSELAYSQGLQQGVSGERVPKWCRFTESELDCPRGELCNFIHRQRFQRTKNHDKGIDVHTLRKIAVSAAIYGENSEILYESHKVALPTVDSAESLNDSLLSAIRTALEAKNAQPDRLAIDFQCIDLVEILLENEPLAAELASTMDKAVEKEAGFRGQEHAVCSYSEVTRQCPLNHRMNASFRALVEYLHGITSKSSIEENVMRLSGSPIMRRKWQADGIILKGRTPAVELAYFATVSYTIDEGRLASTVDVIFPVYDFVFVKRAVLKHHELHCALVGFIEKVVDVVVKAVRQGRDDHHGRMTLQLGYGSGSAVSLLGLYEDGPVVDDRFWAKLQEQPWKRVVRLSGTAPLVLITDCPPVRVMQSAAPQSWINVLKRHCEYR